MWHNTERLDKGAALFLGRAYPLRRFWANFPSCRSRVSEPRAPTSGGWLACDKYIPTRRERSAVACGGRKSRSIRPRIVRSQRIMCAGLKRG